MTGESPTGASGKNSAYLAYLWKPRPSRGKGERRRQREGGRDRKGEREEFRKEGDSIDWAEAHPSFLYGPGKMSLPHSHQHTDLDCSHWWTEMLLRLYGCWKWNEIAITTENLGS